MPGDLVNYLENIQNLPYLDARKGLFTRKPPEVLSPTSLTVTLTPVPFGVYAWTNRFLAIFDNNDVFQEAVQVVGGSVVAGASTGTIIFQSVVGTYQPGQYKIASATAGIQECISSMQYAGSGGTIMLPPTKMNLYASISVPSNIGLVGQGVSSVLFIPDNLWGNFPAWNWGSPGTVCAIQSLVHNSIFLRDFVLDLNGTNQTNFTLDNNNSTGIVLYNTKYSLISGVTIKDNPYNDTFVVVMIALYNNSDFNVVENCNLLMAPVIPPAWGGQGVSIFGSNNKVINCYSISASAFGATSSGSLISRDNIFIGNTAEVGASVLPENLELFYADNAQGTRFIGNNAIGSGAANGGQGFCVITDSSSPPALNTIFQGNNITNCAIGYGFFAYHDLIYQTQISGGAILGCPKPLYFYPSAAFPVAVYTINDVMGLYSQNIFGFMDISGTTSVQNLDINDYGVIRMTNSVNFVLGGFKNGFDCRRLQILIPSFVQVTITHQDSASSVGNRISIPSFNNLVLPSGPHVLNFTYVDLDKSWWLTDAF